MSKQKNKGAKLHYFPWYYLDWLSSSEVRMMNYEERGIYMDMICRCYNDDGLPDDDDGLYRLFNIEIPERVKRMFYSKNNTLFHDKIDKIKKDQRVTVKNASKAGKASGIARNALRRKDIQGGTPVEIPLNENPTNKAKQSKLKQTKEIREAAFAATCKDLEILNEKQVLAFISYWTESNDGDNSKLKFEMQKTWNTSRRLKNWGDRSWPEPDTQPDGKKVYEDPLDNPYSEETCRRDWNIELRKTAKAKGRTYSSDRELIMAEDPIRRKEMGV